MREIKFKHLEIKNFRCHEHIDFDFTPERFVLITGRNGSGKSSILEALFWCLYDETTKGLRGDSIVRKRVGKNCSVKLSFEVDGVPYEIHNYRKHTKYKNGKFLLRQGEDISSPLVKETNRMIEQLILPKDVFLNNVFFSQFVKKPFSEMTHAEQRDVLDKILGMEQYDELRERVIVRQREIEQDILSVDKNIEFHQRRLGELEENRNRLQQELQDLKDQFERQDQQLDSNIKSLKEQLLSYDVSKDEVKKANERFVQKQVELDRINGELKRIEEERLRVKAELTEKYNRELEAETNKRTLEIHDIISTLKQEIERVKMENYKIHTAYQQQVDQIENEYLTRSNQLQQEYGVTISTLETTLNAKKEEIQQLKQRFDAVMMEVSQYETQLQSMQNRFQESICYACGQKIVDHEARERVQREINALQNQLNQKRQERESIKQQGIALVEEAKKIENQLGQIKAEYEEEKSKLDQLREVKLEDANEQRKQALLRIENLQDLKNQLAHHEQELETTRQDIAHELTGKYRALYDKEMARFDREKSQLNEQLNRVQNELREIQTKLQEYNKLAEQKISIEQSITDLESRRVALRQSFERESARLQQYIDEANETLKKMRQECKEQETSKTALAEKIEILNFWKTAFSDTGIKSVLMDEAIPILNEKAMELSQMTENIRVTFDSQRMIKSGDLRDKFTINIVQTDNLTDSRSELSGGEGRLVDIIVLMSLRHLLEQIHQVRVNVVLMDEILDALDVDNVDVVINMLRKLEGMTRVLISHTLRESIEADEILRL